MSTINKVALLIAMREEAEPFIEPLNLERVEPPWSARLPMQLYQGVVHGLAVSLILNGSDPRFGVENVATQPATLSSYLAIEHFDPDLIVNAGTAGGFKRLGSEVGDVYVSSERVEFHDRRIPIPGYDEYGRGSYPVVNVGRLAADLQLKRGIISTGNSLDRTERCLELMDASGAAVKEMEAAAIAWVAWLFHKPFLAVKSITDLVDSPVESEKQFLDNLELASLNLRRKVVEILGYCQGKTVAQLG